MSTSISPRLETACLPLLVVMPWRPVEHDLLVSPAPRTHWGCRRRSENNALHQHQDAKDYPW